MNRIVALLFVVVAGFLGYLLGSAQPEVSAPTAEFEVPTAAEPRVEACPDPEAVTVSQAPPPVPAACASAYEGMTPVDLLALPTDFEQTAALYAMAQQADVETLKGHINDTLSIAVAGERAAALSILFSRFADLDPAESLAHYNELDLQGQSGILFPMFSGWAKNDLTAAIERAKTVTNPADRRTADRAILQANASAPAEELEWIASQLGRSGQISNRASNEALARRAQTEPEAAARTAMALQNPQARMESLAWVVNTWAERDADAAIAFVRGLEEPAMRARLGQIVMSQVAQRSPEKALRLVDTQPSQQQQVMVQTVIMTMARTDPQKALRVVGTLQTQQEKLNAYSGLFSQWAQVDPAGAGAALEGLTGIPIDNKFSMASQIAQAMAASDPEAALEWAWRWDEQAGSPSRQHRWTWDNVVSQIANSDPNRALALAAELPEGSRRTNLVSNSLAQLAATDPLAALDQLDLVPSGQPRRSAMRNVVSNWAQSDPVMAMDWVMTLPPDQRPEALQSVSWSVISSDLALALAYTDDMNPQEKTQWISQLIDDYAMEDPQAAIAWLAEYEHLPQYGEWIGTIAQTRVVDDPRWALKLLARIEEPRQLQAAQLQIIHTWVQFDPIAAGKWWHRQPNEDRDLAVLGDLVSLWSSQDRDAARKWVLRLSDSGERDRALIAYLQNAGHDQADYAKWTLEIENPDMRFQAYQQQLWTLMNGDASRIDEWLQNARLDSDQKAQLQQQIDEMQRQRLGTM